MSAVLSPASAWACDEKDDVVRPTVEYQPSVWGDYFIHFSPSLDQESKSWAQARSEELKQQVSAMLKNEDDPIFIKMDIVDAIQRLGLAYHFEEEIKNALEHIHRSHCSWDCSKHLHTVALRFRLLRQEGYNITPDEFIMFTDQDGNFMETLSGDVKGLLSLYEAAYLAKHGEEILDEAIKFCRHHLKTKLNHVRSAGVAAQISHALETPTHRRSKRLEARQYITIYEGLEDRNDLLLELAKLDFNLLQALHQEEIKNICVWWKELGLASKLTFARDRLVECYFWMLGMYFEPSLSRARIMTTKVLVFISFLDDIYDAYGTLEELQVFTDTLHRWDAKVSHDLPECLEFYLTALVNTFKEFKDVLAKEGHSNRVDFLRKEFNDLATAYLDEAKWRSEGCIPSFEALLSVSLVTSVYPVLICASFIWMGTTEEAFKWVASFPKILKASSAIGRLMNDLVSYEREKKREHVASSIQCYMKEHNTSLEDACLKLQEMTEDAWKDINQESLKPTPLPMPLLMPIINVARISVTFYKDNDGFTDSYEAIKDHVTFLLVQSIPI